MDNPATPSSVELFPVLPLKDVVIFPKEILPLFVGRGASIAAIELANDTVSRQIFLLTQKDSSTEKPDVSDLYQIGVVSRLLQALHLPDGTVKILCEGLYRARCQEIFWRNTCYMARVEKIDSVASSLPSGAPLIRAVHNSFEELNKASLRLPQETYLRIGGIHEPGLLADAVIPTLKIDSERKQSVLEMLDEERRLEEVYEILESELAFSSVDSRIKNRVKQQMERNQREYYLTEQIKAINKEMGREEDPQAELDGLEARIKEKELPQEAREKAFAEVRKLRSMQPSSAEYTVVRNYVDWILDLPWNTLKTTDINIKKARAILESEHYGLEKPKERILEYLAVQKLSNGLKGPILCFVGPPGVGKTSLARSVARATGRDFLRLSLGGVKDEAEIRGHRRTYVGALPGKLIQSLKRTKYNNPLFCLDEIDKMASDYRGDPASALLEVLDPEQNNAFMDHYLDLEYDLSKIFFITTANSLHTIPAPLLDRMEIIELSSYLETEKKHIARKFLIPGKLEEHGLKPENLRISDNAILEIIRKYTHESGVRNLQREIAAICRKAAIALVEDRLPDNRLCVTQQNVRDYLGVEKYRQEQKEVKPVIGVSTGLAYTQSGGEILFVETSIMPGSGQISTTGQLGEVMTESARAALSYVRSRASLFGLDPGFYKKVDIHIHVPAGATPKDGPSAGITLATSITSALLGIPVRNDIAMTGEISLRGRVLPIGGLREKLLAARRSRIKTVLIPADNKKDLEKVPAEVLKDLKIVLVDNVDEVLPIALAASREEIFSGEKLATPLYAVLKSNSQPEETSEK